VCRIQQPTAATLKSHGGGHVPSGAAASRPLGGGHVPSGAKRLKNAIATDTAWRNSSYRQAHALLEPIGLTDTA